MSAEHASCNRKGFCRYSCCQSDSCGWLARQAGKGPGPAGYCHWRMPPGRSSTGVLRQLLRTHAKNLSAWSPARRFDDEWEPPSKYVNRTSVKLTTKIVSIDGNVSVTPRGAAPFTAAGPLTAKQPLAGLHPTLQQPAHRLPLWPGSIRFCPFACRQSPWSDTFRTVSTRAL